MIIHAYLVLCMVFNQTMCREQEIVPDNYQPVMSVMECGRLAFTTRGAVVDRDGDLWIVKGVRCRYEQRTLSDIQKRLRAAVTP